MIHYQPVYWENLSLMQLFNHVAAAHRSRASVNVSINKIRENLIDLTVA